VPPRTTARTQLKPAQQRVLAALEQTGGSQLTRGRYEEIAGVSRSQAAYDIAELVEAGVLERIGGGRSTRYRLTRRQSGKRRWTPERIRSSLEAFCAGRKSWPSAGEFKAAGRGDLYVAASRYGGVAFWSSELGFGGERTARRRWRLPRLPLRALAPAAILAGLLLAVGGGRVFTHPQRIAAKPAITPAVAEPARPRVARVSKPQPRARTPRRAVLVRPAPATQRSEAPVVTRVSARSAARSPVVTSGPAPLAAPSSSGSAAPRRCPLRAERVWQLRLQGVKLRK